MENLIYSNSGTWKEMVGAVKYGNPVVVKGVAVVTIGVIVTAGVFAIAQLFK